MTFHVGQKVTQIKPIAWRGTFDETHPQFGVVYTVRAVNFYNADYYLHFSEIKNPIRAYSDGTFEMDYQARLFRPLVERKTDISIFTKMLTPQGVDA